MWRVQLTPSAVALARRLIAKFDDYDEPTTAILAIRWTPGAKESRRGPSGEAVWETVEPPCWLAEIAPWGHGGSARLQDHAIYVDGIPVLVVSTSKTENGSFTVSEVAGEFRVGRTEA
jgi:hypothetical protein